MSVGICGRIFIALISDELFNSILAAHNHLVEVKTRKINAIRHERRSQNSSNIDSWHCRQC